MTASVLERRIGRKLTAAERHIDVAGIDRLLNEAKDLLDAAIATEQRRVARLIADGQGGRLELTPRMRLLLADLRVHGAAHAANELASMGYPVRVTRRNAASADELEARLRARLGQLTVKVQAAAVGVDLGALSQNAIEDALARILGGRAIAADLVAPAFDAGLSQTFEQHSDLVEAWQYTAVNDSGLCDECAPHDGEIYQTLDALFEVLPDFGPNPDCLGGSRCRCRAVPVPPEGAVSDRQDVTPPSQLFDLGRQRTPASNDVRDALAILDRVHTVPAGAPKIPIKVTGQLPRSNPGQYLSRTDTGAPVAIQISTQASDPGFSLAHEVGHYIDHQLIGFDGVFASAGAPELDAWSQAIESTNAVRQLRRMLTDPSAVVRLTIPGQGTVQIPTEPAFIRYLLQPEELFARSYAQWVATASGDATLRRELAASFRSPYPEQWQDDDFTMVARAFERLMEAHGWTIRR